MKKSLIVFRLEYLRTTGWGPISNFITKFSEKIPMESLDVEVASSIVLEGKWLEKNFSLIKEIDYNRNKFRKIGKPEYIYAANEKYDYVFFVSVEYKQLFDVVDLQNLYLICETWRQYKIIALISGIQSEYHKTSHFFTFLTENKGVMYENVFLNGTG